jgi:hypothetical protein
MFFSCKIRGLANHLFPVEVSSRIVSPLASSQACKLGLPYKVGSKVSIRLEKVNQLDAPTSLTYTRVGVPFLQQGRAQKHRVSLLWSTAQPHAVFNGVATTKPSKRWQLLRVTSTIACQLITNATRCYLS